MHCQVGLCVCWGEDQVGVSVVSDERDQLLPSPVCVFSCITFEPAGRRAENVWFLNKRGGRRDEAGPPPT